MITHKKAHEVPWAVCGEQESGYWNDDAPTCLGCTANTWLALDSQELRVINWFGEQIIPRRLGVPREFLGFAEPSVDIDPTIYTTCSTPAKP
jgi:hypothetical protein